MNPWLHIILGGLLSAIGAIWLGYGWLQLGKQSQSSIVNVECRLLSEGDPSALDCIVSNTGKKEARDVYVGFNTMLPLSTQVLAEPEVGAELIESNFLPDPQVSLKEATTMRAFSIRIPRVASNDSIAFQIRTTDIDNRRAAKQVLRIRQEKQKILKEFGARLLKTYPEEAKPWNYDAINAQKKKKDNFFTPGQFSYEDGRFPIAFISHEEKLAAEFEQKVYARYKREFLDIYQNRPQFRAPVVRIKTSNGDRTYAIFPPYLKTYADSMVKMKTLRQKGGATLYPAVPKSYDLNDK